MLENINELDRPYVKKIMGFLEDTCLLTLGRPRYNGAGIEIEGSGSNIAYALVDQRPFLANTLGHSIKVSYDRIIKKDEDGKKYASEKILDISLGANGQIRIKVRLRSVF